MEKFTLIFKNIRVISNVKYPKSLKELGLLLKWSRPKTRISFNLMKLTQFTIMLIILLLALFIVAFNSYKVGMPLLDETSILLSFNHLFHEIVVVPIILFVFVLLILVSIADLFADSNIFLSTTTCV